MEAGCTCSLRRVECASATAAAGADKIFADVVGYGTRTIEAVKIKHGGKVFRVFLRDPGSFAHAAGEAMALDRFYMFMEMLETSPEYQEMFSKCDCNTPDFSKSIAAACVLKSTFLPSDMAIAITQMSTARNQR